MRKILVLTLVFTTSAFACPDLTGKYKLCRSSITNTDISHNMEVAQEVQNRITTYAVSAVNANTQERETAIYKADGKTRSEVITDPDSGMTIETSSRIHCKNNTLHIDMNMKLNGEEAGYSKIKVVKSGKKLIIDTISSEGETEEKEQEICE